MLQPILRRIPSLPTMTVRQIGGSADKRRDGRGRSDHRLDGGVLFDDLFDSQGRQSSSRQRSRRAMRRPRRRWRLTPGSANKSQ